MAFPLAAFFAYNFKTRPLVGSDWLKWQYLSLFKHFQAFSSLKVTANFKEDEKPLCSHFLFVNFVKICRQNPTKLKFVKNLWKRNGFAVFSGYLL